MIQKQRLLNTEALILNKERYIMTTLIKENIRTRINEEIQASPAWLGKISGLKAEKMLLGWDRPYLYVLREGENKEEVNGICKTDYYITFVLPDLSIKHQPFVISTCEEGWGYYNGCPGGLYPKGTATIDDVLHLIMHCHKDECVPFIYEV